MPMPPAPHLASAGARPDAPAKDVAFPAIGLELHAQAIVCIPLYLRWQQRNVEEGTDFRGQKRMSTTTEDSDFAQRPQPQGDRHRRIIQVGVRRGSGKRYRTGSVVVHPVPGPNVVGIEVIVKTSPRITVNWPALASSILEDSGPVFTNRRCGAISPVRSVPDPPASTAPRAREEIKTHARRNFWASRSSAVTRVAEASTARVKARSDRRTV
jgi:hypothetical protein